jgi:hypothetical protein
VASLAAGAVLSIICFFYFVKGSHSFGWDTTPTVEQVVYLSMFLSTAYVFVTTRTLLDGIGMATLGRALGSLRLKQILPAVLTFALAKGILVFLADPGRKAYGFVHLIKGTTMVSISRPLLFLVAHVVYYGPIVLLLVILWKPFCRTLHGFGLGLTLFVLVNMPLTLTSESRGAISVLPFFVAMVVVASEKLRWPNWYYWTIGAIAVIFSKVWFVMNRPTVEGEILKFPAQNLFMNIGPWMANVPYLIQAAAGLVAGLFLYWMIHRKHAVEHAGEAPVVTLQGTGVTEPG